LAPLTERKNKGPLVGQVIQGRYRVLGALGTGILGTVYLCEEVPANKRVALRVFRREFAKNDEFMNRLHRQVKLAQMSCEGQPSILSVYECGRTDDGGAFVATKYLEGRTLKEVIRQDGPLDVQRALRLACQIAEGLDAIHNKGFVHSEVRAQNVIITRGEEGETATLRGFEVAGLRDTAVMDHMLRAGVISSNPEYASPEQIEGDRVTARTDIYSFGVVLFEMLSGQVPFSASIPDGVLAKHLQAIPAPLSGLRREIPSVVELRVKQALEKEPEKRQRYVADVINEYLCELAADELLTEIARRRPGVVGKITAVWSRLPLLRRSAVEREPLGTRWRVAAAVVLAALLLLAAVAMSPTLHKLVSTYAPSRQRPLAVPPVAERGLPVGTNENTSVSPGTSPPAESVTSTPQELAPTPLTEKTEVPAPTGKVPTPRGLTVRSAPLPNESSLRPPGMPAQSRRQPTRPNRVDTPVARNREAPPDETATASPPSRQETPTSQRNVQDPTAIIDWLLGQPTGGP
jgi:serine/threonine-protein kinase